MKLTAKNIVLAHHRRHIAPVRRCGNHVLLVLGHEPVAVDEVKVGAIGNAIEKCIARLEVNLVPPHVRDAVLRDQATRAAKSACLNTAEGAGRVSRADKARVFAIARAEAGEAAAAIEIACLSGDANESDLARVTSIANRLVAMLTGLIRR